MKKSNYHGERTEEKRTEENRREQSRTEHEFACIHIPNDILSNFDLEFWLFY
jgi:hypothetical protein